MYKGKRRVIATSWSLPATPPLAIFEREGFERVRRLGMHHWIVKRNLPRKRTKRA